jgi:hypothetical protein
MDQNRNSAHSRTTPIHFGDRQPAARAVAEVAKF